MISIIYSYQFIRMIWIGHNRNDPVPAGPELWFHSTNPPAPPIASALQALIEANDDSAASQLCFRALLGWTQEQLLQEKLHCLTGEDKLWGQIFDVCQNLFRSDIALADVAAAVGISPVRLSRLLHARTGDGFRPYLNSLRLDYAKRLLLTSEITVDEVAQQSGFNYSSYFIRVFVKRFGCSPSNFRTENRPETGEFSRGKTVSG